MGLRSSVKIFLIAILFFSAVAINSIHAAWWQSNSMLVPGNTEEVNKEKGDFRGAQLEFTYYESALSIEDIKSFYQQKLSAAGWTEKNMTKSMANIPGTKEANSTFGGLINNNMLFDKDSDSIIITFVPQQGSLQSGKTRYSICKGNLAPKSGAQDSYDYVPKLEAKPKRDIAPVYPGSSLMALAEEKYSSKITYFTRDALEPVEEFFKLKMPSYDWEMVKEAPAQKLNYGSVDALQFCPSCAKAKGTTDKPIDIWNAELDFRNNRGDICRVVVSEISPVEKSIYATKMTIISISYDERK